MAVAAAKPEVFTRKSSGLVRVMSPYSAFIYNILTMGLIFPWTYLWAPGALPGGRLVWGILLAMIFEIPIALTYVWYVEALTAIGRRDQARKLFEKLLAIRNPLGLLSEDYDPKTGELWGNFPQTYSMVGLINAARGLSTKWSDLV